MDRFASTVGEWLVLSLSVGLIGAWIRRLQNEQPDTSARTPAYESAYRLLSQLRLVARELSVGLDSVSLAEGLLERVAAITPFDRGAVYVRSGGDRLIPLAYYRDSQTEWDVDLGPDTVFSDAWVSQEPQSVGRPLTPRTGERLQRGRPAEGGSADIRSDRPRAGRPVSSR